MSDCHSLVVAQNPKRRLSHHSIFLICWLGVVIAIAPSSVLKADNVFPTSEWETATPQEMQLDEAAIIEVANLLGGRGCIIKDGYLVHAWGDQKKRGDWLSSAKPVLSTLLFFALQEGLIDSVDQRVSDFDDRLMGKDREITFRHLGSMTSGYLRP
ncbi:MAG: hypothetical protein KDA52_16815, partial [Planctomycetaceae bacterium]|nr:hypothetical protein [Planctomycetaceae bacterium]